MAPMIWGLDLAEIKWSKFKSSYMWNNEYHLRRTKFIVHQLALIFCVVSESLGTAALSDYVDEQKRIAKITNHAVHAHNNDYVGAASYNIFAGVFVAFIFGAAFFFDLFWPERREIHGVRLAWKVCGVLAVVFHLASALTMTIITAMHSSFLTGAPPEEWQGLVSQYSKAKEAPLRYRHNGRAVAAVCFAWPGFFSVLGSCILLFMSINHDETFGPKSSHARLRDEKTAGNVDLESTLSSHEKPIQEPAPTHQHDGPTDTPTTPEAFASAPAAGQSPSLRGTVDAGQAAAEQRAGASSGR